MAEGSRSLDGFSAAAGRTGAASMRFAANLLAMGAAVVGLKKSIAAAADMETAVAGLAKATDLDATGLAGMKTELMALSVELKGVKLDDLIAIATTGAKMGVAAGDLVEYARGIAMVSTAMDDVPAAEIADSLGKINVIFKLGVGGAMQMGSAIDKLADSGTSAAKDIMEVTARVSGTASLMRLSAQETVSLAAALLDTGTQAELASGAIAGLLQALATVKGQEGAARAIGIPFEQFAEMVHARPIKAVEAFLRVLKKMELGEATGVLGGMGIEGRQTAGEIAKLALQVDALDKYIGQANHEFETLDQINKSYAQTAATTNAQWIEAKNQVQILAVTVGESLLPAINKVLPPLIDLAKGVGEAFKESTAAVSGWAAAVNVDFEAVGASARNLSKVMKFLGLSFVSGLGIDVTAEIDKLFADIENDMAMHGKDMGDGILAGIKKAFDAGRMPDLPGPPAAKPAKKPSRIAGLVGQAAAQVGRDVEHEALPAIDMIAHKKAPEERDNAAMTFGSRESASAIAKFTNKSDTNAKLLSIQEAALQAIRRVAASMEATRGKKGGVGDLADELNLGGI